MDDDREIGRWSGTLGPYQIIMRVRAKFDWIGLLIPSRWTFHEITVKRGANHIASTGNTNQDKAIATALALINAEEARIDENNERRLGGVF